MRTIGDKIASVSLTMSVLGLGACLFLLFTPSVNVPQKESVAAQKEQEQTVAENQKDVLGISDAVKCPSEQEYLQKLEVMQPEIQVKFGTEMKSIPAKELLACAEKTAEVGALNDCRVYQVNFNETCVENYLTTTLQFSQPKENLSGRATSQIVPARISDEIVDYQHLSKDVIQAYKEKSVSTLIMNDYTAVKILAVKAPTIANLPNTDGLSAARYLEFDGSRQLMFLWENGQYKTFKISGAFPEYNPVGVFTILNKSPLAWSSTANKWMPYWQAFTYDKQQQAMLGIHALVFWYPGFEKSGDKRIYEPISNIGKPRSTGCLRLTLEDAKRVYAWSKVGDLVVVHN